MTRNPSGPHGPAATSGTTVPGPVDVAFDHWDPELARDPHPRYAALRGSAPVCWSSAHGGFWVLTGYDEVVFAARNPDVFSSRLGSIPEEIGLAGLPLPPLTVDPPEHARSRQLLLPFFSPQRARALDPLARRVSAELLREAVSGRLDAASQFALPLPTRIVAALLGVDPSDEDRFATWIHAIVEHGATQRDEALLAGLDACAYFAELLAQRREQPGDDLVSLLARPGPDGETLAFEEALGCCVLLLIAGIDTTWSTLGAAVAYLATDPEAQGELRRQARAGALEPEPVEELLRLFAPTSVARLVREDLELSGRRLRRGERALLVFPAANRDPAVFPDPDRALLARAPNRHVAFGEGIHKCLGIHLARMELRVALEELLRRTASFGLDGEVSWKPGPIRGPLSVPLRIVVQDAPGP